MQFLPPPLDENASDDTLNTFRGFWWQNTSVEADSEAREPGGTAVELFDDLLLHICGDIHEHSEWLKGLFGHMLLHPGELEGLAVVLYGAKGCGKSLVVQLISKLLAQDGPSSGVMVSETRNPGTDLNTRFSNANKRDQKLLMRVDEARIADEQLHNMFKAMIDQHEMQCEPKNLGVYLACNVCRIVFTGNSSNTVPVQSTDRKFVVLSANNRYTSYDPSSQAVWDRIFAKERWCSNRNVLKALADYLLQHAKSVEELVRTAPETTIMAEQRAKNAIKKRPNFLIIAFAQALGL